MYDKLVLNIPHASLGGLTNTNWSDRRVLYNEVRKWTDWFTDYIFDHQKPNTYAIISQFSRFVVDCERLVNDPLEKVGRGILYMNIGDGCARELRTNEKRRLLAYYLRHQELLRRNLTENSLLIDCHSFPSNEADIDICIGYNEDWSKPNDFTLNLVRDTFKNAGYSVVFNKPYSNSISPRATFYYPSLMIEVNKRCYMDEDTLRLTDDADRLRSTINNLYTMLLTK